MSISKITGLVAVYLDGMFMGDGFVTHCPSGLTSKERSWNKRWRRRLKRWCQFDDDDIREVNAVMKDIEYHEPGFGVDYYRRLACARVRFEAGMDMWWFDHFYAEK